MKYIRTKDNRIIEFTPKQKYENDKTTFDWFVANYCGGGINVSKVADTIEELCDTIAIIWKDHLPTIWNDAIHFKDLLSMYSSYQRKHKIVAIYGSIWVDGDLHKVAKINDKGELELL